MIRIAAVGDVHAGEDSAGTIAPDLDGIEEQADVLLLAGDLTTHGRPEQAAVLAAELRDVTVPVIAVLGNHDHHDDRPEEVAAVLRDAGVVVLERTSTVVDTPNGALAVAGAKGFGGGFAGACATEFGEPEMKAFVRVTADIAHELEAVTREARADATVVLLHYSPVRDTLVGEPPEIFPFLGSYLLAEAVDRAGADLIFHGHAHRGAPAGVTAAGIPVRNVARPVLRRAFGVFMVDGSDRRAGVGSDSSEMRSSSASGSVRSDGSLPGRGDSRLDMPPTNEPISPGRARRPACRRSRRSRRRRSSPRIRPIAAPSAAPMNVPTRIRRGSRSLVRRGAWSCRSSMRRPYPRPSSGKPACAHAALGTQAPCSRALDHRVRRRAVPRPRSRPHRGRGRRGALDPPRDRAALPVRPVTRGAHLRRVPRDHAAAATARRRRRGVAARRIVTPR